MILFGGWVLLASVLRFPPAPQYIEADTVLWFVFTGPYYGVHEDILSLGCVVDTYCLCSFSFATLIALYGLMGRDSETAVSQ